MAIEVDKDGRLWSKDAAGNRSFVPGENQEQWKGAVAAAMERNKKNTVTGQKPVAGRGPDDFSGLRFVVAKKDDNLWKIAKDLGVSWQQICDDNDFRDDNLIQVGDVIVVSEPKPKDAASRGQSGVEAFARSLTDRARRAAAPGPNVPSNRIKEDTDKIGADAKAYMAEIDGNDELAFKLIGRPEFNGEAAWVRKTLIESYLEQKPERLDGKPGRNPRQEAFNALLSKDRKWEGDGDKIRADIREVGAQKYRLQPPPG